MGGRRPDDKKAGITSRGEANETGERDGHSVMARSAGATGRKFKYVTKSHFPAMFLPMARVRAAVRVWAGRAKRREPNSLNSACKSLG